MGDLGERMTDLDDGRRLSNLLIFNDFHTIHVSARTFGIALGPADDVRLGIMLQRDAAFDHAVGKSAVKDNFFVYFDPIIIMSENPRNKLDDCVIAGLNRVAQVKAADAARRQREIGDVTPISANPDFSSGMNVNAA